MVDSDRDHFERMEIGKEFYLTSLRPRELSLAAAFADRMLQMAKESY